MPKIVFIRYIDTVLEKKKSEENKMFGFGQLIDILKKNPKKIVFTEGNDPRILEAASRLLASNFLHPILVGNPDEIAKVAEESGFNIRGAEIIDPMK
mgnify:FL=1